MSREPDAEPAADEAPPPLLGRWRNVYALLAGSLAAIVIVLYLVTRWAS